LILISPSIFKIIASFFFFIIFFLFCYYISLLCFFICLFAWMLQIRDFTSPHTIRVEAGLSSMMEQYDRNFKVRQIMGSRASFKGNAGSTASKVSTGSSESAGTLANEARAPERPGKPPSNKR